MTNACVMRNCDMFRCDVPVVFLAKRGKSLEASVRLATIGTVI